MGPWRATMPEAPRPRPASPHYEANGRVFMDAVYRSQTSADWRAELDTQPSEQWFKDLSEFVPNEVKKVFNHPDRPPTAAELATLPFHAEYQGVYADVLTPKPSRNGLSPYLYPGAVPRRTAETRKWEHRSPEMLLQYPTNLYYQLKHGGTKDYIGCFVTLVKMRMTLLLGKAQTEHMRVLCRVGETLFTLWLKGFQPTHTRAIDMVEVSDSAFQVAYPNCKTLELLGLATHSPLTEQVGKKEYGTVERARYEEAMEKLAEEYGGMNLVPDEAEAEGCEAHEDQRGQSPCASSPEGGSDSAALASSAG